MFLTRQAQLGAFAIVALLLLFGIFFIITDYGTRHNGYRVGVHFASASGLPSGAQVFFSGVVVGTVDQVQLLPDNTVDVILAIQPDVNIPKDSKFLIQSPLTGTANFFIIPPPAGPRIPGYVATPLPASAMLPRQVLPLDQQPAGITGATVADLLSQGQGEIKRLDAMLVMLQEREPKLLNTLQTALSNVDLMSAQLKTTVADVSGTMEGTMRAAGANIVSMTGTLNSTLGRNQYKIDSMLASLDSTALALSQSMDGLRVLATDPKLHTNLIDTTQNIRDLTQNLSGVTSDLRQVTGNPQTQAQLRDTVAHLDATMQKANSLLGTLGGQSRVPGVDAGATPYPLPDKNPVPPSALGTPSPLGTVAPLSASLPQPQSSPNTARINAGLAKVVKNLVAVQLRLSYLNKQMIIGPTALLTADRGPQADMNVVLLPRGGVSLMAGANDIGGKTTYNVAGIKTLAPGIRFGGGVLYSQLGALATFDAGYVGAEARLYNLRNPVFDFYGNFNVAEWAKLFLGERDVTRPDRRTVFGLQLQF
ncbi:MAG TPA: MlaD family protein [Candidatus Rubrimentiphilum sp.]|nr:MlaD family protein [Candidatus Rubrimentiphilum sp.]